jgi:photosystem II stability/assembly factor-like uncharacterized protein
MFCKFVAGLKIFLCLFFASIFICRSLAWAAAYSFLVVGDGVGNSEVSLKDARARHPQISFVMTTGDNDPAGNYRGWDGFNEKVHDSFGENFPWFPTIGNHNVDHPEDISYLKESIVPRLSMQLPGASNFSTDVLPDSNIGIAAFNMFRQSDSDDKRAEVINALIAAGLGHLEPAGAGPLEADFFVWEYPELSLAEFDQELAAVDCSSCPLDYYRLDTEEEIKARLPWIYMANKVSPYSFDYQNAHFVVLNLYYDYVVDNPQLSARQKNWFQNDLSSNTQPIVFVFGHEPGYPFGNRHLGDSLDQNPAERDAFFELIRQHNGVAYFSGHTHVYGRSYHDGVYDVGVGTVSYVNNELGRFTYVVVNVSDNLISFETYGSKDTSYTTQFSLIDCWNVHPQRTQRINERWQSITPGPGGWVTACAIDPNNSNRVLVGGDVLGSCVSDDGGLTWNPSYGFGMNDIESFLMPKHAYGGSSYYEFAATMGGVYESFDGGRDWMAKTAGDWPELSEERISRPVSSLSYSSSGWLYSASGTVRMQNESVPTDTFGLIYRMRFYSDTQSWELVKDLKTVTGGAANIQHIVAHEITDDVDRIFVSLRNNGVWRSSDHGMTWVKTSLPANQVFMLVQHPSNPNILYAAAGDDGIYKTGDGGDSWTRSIAAPAQVIGLSEQAPDVLYAGVYSGQYRGVIKTTNGGSSWTKVFDAYNMPPLPYSQGSTNIRYHALAVDPKDPNHAIVGDDVNLYVTFDGGATWNSSGGSSSDGGRFWSGSNFGGLCGEMIAFDAQEPDHFLLGAADGGLWQTWDGGRSFTRNVPDSLGVPGGDPGEVFTDFQDGAISYEDGRKIYLIGDVYKNDQGSLFRTTDGGATWQKRHDGPFVSVEVKKGNDQVVLAIGSNNIYRSTDGGSTFTEVSSNIGARRLSSDPLSAGTFYATSTSGVHRSIDSGQTWTNIGGPHLWGYFGSVAVDPADPGSLYATAFDGFWRYSGSSWQRVKTVEFASDITVARNGTVYGVTTSFPSHDIDPITTGIWKSTDQGNSWHLDIEGLRIRRITMIEAHPIDPLLVIAASDGGGFFARPNLADSSDNSTPQAPSRLRLGIRP